MQNDYEILGLDLKADKDAIKKAYFKMVRQFSPEKDPERFQEIRGAYERLTQAMDKENKDLYLKMEGPGGPDAEAAINEIKALLERNNYHAASAAAEHAINDFGEYEIFLYMLAISQKLDEHPGKAIKNYEKLLKRYPDKNIYKRDLASTYFDRGFFNKAITAFEDAYQSGVRDIDFILEFAMCCSHKYDYNRGVTILIELVKNFDNKSNKEIEAYMEAYMQLFGMAFFVRHNNYFEEIIKLYINFLKTTGRLLKKHADVMVDIAFIIIMHMNKADDYVNEVLEETKKHIPKNEYQEELKIISNQLEYNKFKTDTRLSKEMQLCWEAFISAYDDYDNVTIRFMQTDCKLLIIERLPEIKKEFDIIKSDYPNLYEKMEKFFKQLDQNDISYLKEKLLKDYDRGEKYISGGHYYKLYPQNRLNLEKLQWNSSENGSFVRGKKKIGRNDPCPCGSGKKYKQCCGKNIK